MAFNGEILEVFSWLGAKALTKFSSCSKACAGYLSDPFFIKKQTKNMGSKRDCSFFIQPYICQRVAGNLEFHVLPGEEDSEGVPSESVEFMKINGRVLASSNGLVCCRNISYEATMDQYLLFICNPATRSWLGVPSPANLNATDMDLHVFFHCNIESHDQFPRDYLLMLMDNDQEDWSNSLSCKIYVPKEEIWLEVGHIDCGGRNLLFQSGVYQSGTVYFLSDWFPYFKKNSPFHWPYIVAFNPGDQGKSRFLKVPKEARKGLTDRSCRMCIFAWEENSICLVKSLKGVLIVWVLRDFNLGSWSRILKIRGRAMRMVEPEPVIAGFTVLNGSMLLIATTKRVYQYDFAGDWRSRRVQNICRHQCGRNVLLSSYSSTLRPCGDGAALLQI